MSHFSAMVLTSERPSKDLLAHILQPWHEFECTGTNDQYVQDVDDTADQRADFEDGTVSRLRAPDGTLHCPYDHQFYRDPTEEESAKIGPVAGTGGGHGMSWHSRDWDDGQGYRTKIRFVPDGFSEVEIPKREVFGFRQWLAEETGRLTVPYGETPDIEDEHKHGYTLLTLGGDVFKTFRRTNPKAKWDWWSIGGRWSGMLAPAYDPATDPENSETCWLCRGTGKRTDMVVKNGCNACAGTGLAVKHPSSWRQHGNVAQIKDLDLPALREEGGRKAGETYDRRKACVGGHAIPDWDALVAQHGINAMREVYWQSPAMRALSAAGEHFLDKEDLRELRGPREAAVARGRLRALSTFALVRDGQWFERGSMGWFGCVSDEKDRDAWDREFAALLDGLPPETWVSIIDCHI